MMGAQPKPDVVIVGAGLAGAIAALVLSKNGHRVTLVDARRTYPNCFKAEKIETDQADQLRKFCLLEGLIPLTSRIEKIVSARENSILKVRSVEQYGILYQDMVNGVRKQLPASVIFKVDRVKYINPGPDISTVTLMSGETIAAHLVVVACGRSGHLLATLGIRYQMIREHHSFSLGFNIARDDGERFPFNALTYYPGSNSTRVAYLTLFPIRDVMRANYFVYRLPEEDWVHQFRKNPEARLKEDLPDLTCFTAPFHVTGRVEMCPIDLYRAEGYLQPGLVLLGDAYQGACPTTGTGVTKVLTDVDVLCNECIPEWALTSGMGVEKIQRYYGHPRKQACDEKSLRNAEAERMCSLAPSLPWRIRRELKYFLNRLL